MTITLKPSKKTGSFRISVDKPIILEHVQSLDKGFKLSKEHVIEILAFENEVVQKLSEVSKEFDPESFVSSVRVDAKHGKYLRVVTDLEGAHQFFNITLSVKAVKVSQMATRISWEITQCELSSFTTEIVSDDESETFAEPTPDDIITMTELAEARKDSYRKYLLELLEEVNASTYHNIDELEEKLVNGMK